MGEVRDPGTSKAARRKAFVADVVPRLAAQLGPISPWTTDMALSRRFAWFADADRLVVVATPVETQRDVDLALAYGLGHTGDRELHLVLPAGTAEPTRRRLPWIDAPVQLHTYADDTVTPVAPLARAEVLAAHDDLLVTAVHQLGDRSAWITRLVQWADASPELVPAHRTSYLAWHCRGRLILRVKRRRGGLTVSAGVHGAGYPVHEEHLTGPLTPEAHHRLTAAASLAIADRLGGIDTGHAEHQLQERLASVRNQLGLDATIREFPAMRPVDNRGYIDLLGVGRHGTLHVVETKIGADPMLVLQGLDYWIWATAHATELAAHLGDELERALPTTPEIVLDIVVADHDGTTLSPYSAAQLDALDGSIRWQVHQIDRWRHDDTTITSFGRRRVPPVPRATEPRYAVRLDDDLITRAGDQLERRVFFTEPGGGVIEAARPTYQHLVATGAAHRFVDHVRSSQAFALNLLAGLDDDEVVALWGLIHPDVVTADGVELEYVDPHDTLAELQPSRPHQTQVDALLRGTTRDGQRVAALVEVKLSETAFGSCSAFEAEANDRRDVCRSGGAWGGDPDACFQLRNQAGPHRRRYDEHLLPGWVAAGAGGGCPFRTLNQPMRNVAMARALVDRGEADRAVVALCAPLGNTNVWRQWRSAHQLFARVPRVGLVDLPAEQVVRVLGPQRRSYLADRYGLTGEVAP